MTTINNQAKPLLSVAIVTMNRSAEVLRAIQSVYDQKYPNFEIVVVDNHSIDNTVESIEAQFPDVKLIKLHRNLGCTGGRNVALANGRGEVLFNLDDDAVVKPDTLTTVMDFFATAPPEMGLVACQIFENGAYRFPEQSSSTGIFEGCGWAIRRSVFQQVGYFSDHLSRQGDEADFALNYLASGYKMWYLSQATIHHMPSSVRSEEEISFYKCRNELILIFERYPLILILPFVIWTLLSQLKSGIYKPTHLPYMIKGFVSGLLQSPGCLSVTRKPIDWSILQQVRFSPMYRSKMSRFLQVKLNSSDICSSD